MQRVPDTSLLKNSLIPNVYLTKGQRFQVHYLKNVTTNLTGKKLISFQPQFFSYRFKFPFDWLFYVSSKDF